MAFFCNRNQEKIDCLYRIYPLGGDVILPKCTTESGIQMILEQRIGVKKSWSTSIKSFYDLTHVNVFQRILSTLFYIHDKSTYTLIPNKNITIIPVNM